MTRMDTTESCFYDAGSRQFTGKERDAESGLDYFGARYMRSAQGRWTSPDLVNVTNDRLLGPSSTLNKYVYGGNNPLKFTDPDGRDITVSTRADILVDTSCLRRLISRQTTSPS